ncbi:hypothetical protein Ocin01_00668 [Orchesella cincta]|uniref:Uncharacterized protein n=1 Tax=Orchesella cincta TaxID=48709 RepID=A0A1D2NLN1_ORCCI|nr:hypothetical protein Ocin01_00668 [Orchesella cincta]
MTAKSKNTDKTDLDAVVLRNLEDIKQLESQIQGLLKTMQSTESIERIPKLSLPESKSLNQGENPEVRMQWHGPEDPKRQRRGKAFPEDTMKGSNVSKTDKELSDFDIIEMCIKDTMTKYRILEDSVFFTPVLERCVFGMTLLNAAGRKLQRPSMTLSILLPAGQEKRNMNMRSFHYSVQTTLKDQNPDKISSSIASSTVPYQDTLWSNLDQSELVMPGGEILLTANFSYPANLLEDRNDFSLLASITLDGEELWTKEIPITEQHFNAASIDCTFKKHHVSIFSSIGVHREGFKLERLAVENDKSPQRSMERFLLPMGYENISSYKTGIDTSVEIYAINQPSLLWGTCFKLEKSSRKPNSIRCQISTRTTEQMQLIFSQFKSYLRKEMQKDKQRGMSSLMVSALNSDSNVWIRDKVEKEVQLIQKLPQLRSTLKKEKESGRTQKWKTSTSSNCNIDSCWIQEYSSCVAETDTSFTNKM